MLIEKLRAFHIDLAPVVINDRPFTVYLCEIKLTVKPCTKIVTVKMVVVSCLAVHCKISSHSIVFWQSENVWDKAFFLLRNVKVIDWICTASRKRGAYDIRAISRFGLGNFKHCKEIAFIFRIGIIANSGKCNGDDKRQNDNCPPKFKSNTLWAFLFDAAVTVFRIDISVLIRPAAFGTVLCVPLLLTDYRRAEHAVIDFAIGIIIVSSQRFTATMTVYYFHSKSPYFISL